MKNEELFTKNEGVLKVLFVHAESAKIAQRA